MTVSEFCVLLKQMKNIGWTAEIRVSEGIQMRRPNGRRYCYNPIAAVYCHRFGKSVRKVTVAICERLGLSLLDARNIVDATVNIVYWKRSMYNVHLCERLCRITGAM